MSVIGLNKMAMKKYYEGIKTPGENLYEAICNSAYSNGYNPPLIENWIENQADQYLEPEWDYEWIRVYMHDVLEHSELNLFFEILIENKFDIDCPFLDQINRNDLKEMVDKYTGKKKKVCEIILKKLLDDLENDKRFYRTHEIASDDFDIFFQNIDSENDDEVRDFFGIEAKVEGYDIDGEELGLGDLFICPYCADASKIWEQEDVAKDLDEDYDSTKFICEHCQATYDISSEIFIETNEHIPKPELIARGV